MGRGRVGRHACSIRFAIIICSYESIRPSGDQDDNDLDVLVQLLLDHRIEEAFTASCSILVSDHVLWPWKCGVVHFFGITTNPRTIVSNTVRNCSFLRNALFPKFSTLFTAFHLTFSRYTQILSSLSTVTWLNISSYFVSLKTNLLRFGLKVKKCGQKW